MALDAIREAALKFSKLRKKKEDEVNKPESEKPKIELDEEKVEAVKESFTKKERKYKFGRK